MNSPLKNCLYYSRSHGSNLWWVSVALVASSLFINDRSDCELALIGLSQNIIISLSSFKSWQTLVNLSWGWFIRLVIAPDYYYINISIGGNICIIVGD